MKKEKATLGEMMLVGLTARTNNKNEMDMSTGKIPGLFGLYWTEKLGNAIQHRANPGVTYGVYTEFESDEHGDYTFFIGEVVNSLDGQDLEKFNAITIPASDYQKFTTEPGPMPHVVISAWQKIWGMNEKDFGGKRKYIADFEVYDERAMNPNSAALDIYIGIGE